MAIVAAIFLSAVLLWGAAATAQPVSASDPEVTVQPGDSWESVRGRLFPVDALRRANPRLDATILRPGDVVQAPYVHRAEFARERAAREALDRQLTETERRMAELEKKSASLEARSRAVDQAERSVNAWRAVMIVLGLVVLGLLVLLGISAKASLTAHRNATEAAMRERALRSRYDELRQSLHDIDVKLQARVVSLLRLHGGRIVTDAELAASLSAVTDFTQELKKQHETT
jgi:hypothetical protein